MSYKASLIHTIRNKILLFREYAKRLKQTVYKERMLLFANTYEQEYDIGQSMGKNEIFEDLNAKIQFMLDYFGGKIEKTRRRFLQDGIFKPKKDDIPNNEAEYELSTYNHDKHKNSQGKETGKTRRAYRLHRNALAEISLIIKDQKETQEIKDENIDLTLKLIKSKLYHVQKIMLDLPRLNLSNYEMGKITSAIHHTLRKANKIRTHQNWLKHPENPTRLREELLYYPKYKRFSTPPVRPARGETSRLDPSVNHVEYQRITTAYYFIVQELDKIIDKQLSHDYLLNNFNAKNDYLTTIKPKLHKDEDIHTWMLNHNKEKPDPLNKEFQNIQPPNRHSERDVGCVKPINETHCPIQSSNLPTGTQLPNLHPEKINQQAQNPINPNAPFY